VSPVLVPLLFVIHTLSLHDALPISIAFALMAFIVVVRGLIKNERPVYWLILAGLFCLSLVLHIIPLTIGENLGHDRFLSSGLARSEEHTSELQSRENLVCRLLLVKQ